MSSLKPSIILRFLLLSFILFLNSSPEASGTTIGEITQALTCTCGCNMVVGACEGAMECSSARAITEEVTRLVSKGKSRDQIIKYFVEKYGEKILSAPTKKGFNLTAWILPFLSIVLGGGLLYLFLSKCLTYKRTKTDHKDNSDDMLNIDKQYMERINNELKEYDI